MTHPELVSRCLARAPGAWEEFLRRFSDLIYSTTRPYGLTEDDRREVYQVTVLALTRQLESLRDPERLVSWIIGIATRQAAMRVRLRSREREMEQIDDSVIAQSRAPSPPIEPSDEELLRLERAQIAHEAVASLSERCRRMLTALFWDEQVDYRELAARERISIGSVGPLRARCLERARAFLLGRGWLDN